MTVDDVNPVVVTDAHGRISDGVLREEDVRGGYAGGTVGDQTANLSPTDVARVGSGSISDYLNGSQAMPATMPDADRADLDALYAGRNYAPLWFGDAGWNDQAQQLVSAFTNATVDGLLPRDYLHGEQVLPTGLTPGGPEVAQIDLELTAGLIATLGMPERGRYLGSNTLDAVPFVRNVMAAETIDAGLVNAVNQGETYQEIRRRGLTDVQYLNPAEFDAYRVTMEYLRANPVPLTHEGKYVISNVAVQEAVGMRDGSMELGMNMVVGRPTRATPIKDDGIVNIKFPPTGRRLSPLFEKDLNSQAPEILQEMNIQVRVVAIA